MLIILSQVKAHNPFASAAAASVPATQPSQYRQQSSHDILGLK